LTVDVAHMTAGGNRLPQQTAHCVCDNLSLSAHMLQASTIWPTPPT